MQSLLLADNFLRVSLEFLCKANVYTEQTEPETYFLMFYS